tara:strand:+ start:1283 stop:1987 length:705 start_codon:yes stop_codon:yes gene_type:complete
MNLMDNSLSLITLSNKGYLKYTKNLLASIQKNKLNIDLNIYVMDVYSFNYFKKINQNVFLIDGLNSQKFLRQDSQEFGTYMLQKLKIIHNSLSNFENVIYLDGDIVIKKNFLQYFETMDDNYDLLIQNDKNPKKPDIEYLCAGFMKIKSSKETLKFFNPDNISTEIIMRGLHDQQYINENKHKLNYKKLPLDLFPNGAHYYLNHKELDPYIIHFNYIIGSKKKKLMKKHNEWYL